MSTSPQPALPLLYKDLTLLRSTDHKNFKLKPANGIKELANNQAIPLTSEEFVQAQVHYPIVFTGGEDPIPVALMGLTEGVNVFVNEEGRWGPDIYLPAYVRRYPFNLIRLKPESEDLALCFDQTSGLVGEFEEGQDLFEPDDRGADALQNALKFCERFEQAAQRTQKLMKEISPHDIWQDAEIAVTSQAEASQTYLYRGFRIVNQDKLRALDASVREEWFKSGILAVIFAHVFSLQHLRTIFDLQVEQGKMGMPHQRDGH